MIRKLILTQFYTCEATTRDAFFGCCTINPCANNGCPRANLAGAYLSGNPAEAADMDPHPPVDGSSVSASSAIEDPTPTSPPVTSRPSSTGSSDTDSTAIPDTESESFPVGATIGISVGGFVLLCAVLTIVLLVRRNARKSSVQHDLTRKSSLAPPNVPVYPEHSAPAPRYLADTYSTQSTEPQQNGYTDQQSDAKTVSVYKPYSPFSNHSSQYSLQPKLASSSPYFSGATQSVCWNNNSREINSRGPVESQYSNQQFARVHQGPPQELGCGFDDDLSHRFVTPGVQHIRDVNVDESKRLERR